MRVWLAGSPWRLTGVWLALAGLVASAGLRVQIQSLWSIALALLLADPLWGALWAQIAEGATATRPLSRPRLPYAVADSPAGQLWRWLGQAPVIVVAGLVAWLLGPLAMALTGLALVLASIGGLASRAGLNSWVGWLRALTQVTLPFTLGVTLAGPWPAQPEGLWLASLLTAFTLLAVATELFGLNGARGDITALAMAGTAVCAFTLLVAGLPLVAGLIVLLAVGPLLALQRADLVRPAALQTWWWLLAMVAALSLGLGSA